MTNLSTLGEKIRMIREAENLNRKEMAELIGASYGTLNNYETKGVLVTETVLVKLTSHPRFEKYTLWLMTGKTNEAMGQISPTLSPDGADATPSDHSERKIG
ncbi:helix-turn-helix domain-containing protein [Morganella morganii]|uniref:helix-turn-helix domain-containing protein n=1 Tax=Morganella morganii TaxID=582 RepID=UPI000F84CEF8|nr:helix-turn-helix transcriptional regulator [Morganella morganii]ELA9133468.1 helix-turn-helix transcriptional regulator [Morganella morganii]ELO7538567.1 helix-turn-helix transcriptional regulator [Morganella morganii]MBO8065914.1 helix-turn-helix transcriptional regulator [Morganella morganii]QSB91786.1 helix-turn-helix transcriptional regulator [Morganella morganii]RTY22157.1 XRE family transcriptional regulator [Morganella morganii subsp. morganii]